MPTNEYIKRAVEKAYDNEFGDLLPSQLHGVQQAAKACCAHLSVGYVRQHLGAGKERGWWQCTECEMKFVPSETVKA